MPRVGFEHTTPMVEWSKIVHALGRAANLIGARTHARTHTHTHTHTYIR
jgi:hypothetical protein